MSQTYKIAAFYRFTPQTDIPALQESLRARFEKLGIKGTVLLAPEGVNGTIAGFPENLDQAVQILVQDTGIILDEVKYSASHTAPFMRLKVRPKKEIITFKQPQADPYTLAGTYVDAADWNDLISDPDVTILDTRNIYETRIGIFEGAIDPKIETFTEFAAFVKRELDPTRNKKVAMFCTGGIRCEKASAFMRAEGFPEVYHLKGGILKYLETVPAEKSLWNGECYVFDRRMGVQQGLTAGNYSMCYACGDPLTQDDRAHAHFEQGVSCPHCFTKTSDDDKSRFRMRQKQIAKASALTTQA